MKLIDIHRHSNPKDSSGPAVMSLNLSELKNAEEQSIPFCAGLHPWWLKDIELNHALELIKKLSTSANFLCMGEMGLDRAIETDFETQTEAFKAQLMLAKKLSPKAVVIHCVRAFNEVISTVNKAHYTGTLIFHDYNAGAEITEELIKRGYYFSFGRHLFNEKTKAYKVFSSIPLSQIFFETDEFDVSIDEVYTRAAQIRSLSKDQLVLQIEKNYQLLFG